MQELSKNAVSEPDDQLAPPAVDADSAELRQELSKWQARVPKLAAALRERSGEVAALQAQLDTVTRPDPGTQARDDLIAELETKLGALNSKHQDLQGQVHSRDMEINSLRQDVVEWKQKWQSVTRSLDDQAAQAAGKETGLQNVKDELAAVKETLKARIESSDERDHELQMLRDEAESLGKRNAQLFETTELANRQIASLGESLTDLRDQVAAKDTEVDNMSAQYALLTDQLAARTDQNQRLDSDIDALHTLVETKQQAVAELEARLTEQAAAAAQTAELEESLALARRHVADREEQILGLQRNIEAQAVEFQQRLDDQAANSQQQLDEQAAKSQQQLDEQTASLRQAMQEQAIRSQQTIDAGVKKHAELEALAESQHRELAEQAAQHTSFQHDQQAIEHERRERDARIAELETGLEAARQEAKRLESCVSNAEQVTNAREAERRQLSAQVEEASERIKRLEKQLEERSGLVVGLEQEKIAGEQAAGSLRSDNAMLKDKLQKTERHAAEHAEHITQLDSRLERQKELMADLEEELMQAREQQISEQKAGVRELADKNTLIARLRQELEAATAPAEQPRETEVVEPSPAADPEELAKLRGEVQKLERMLRDCTEEINTRQWQHDIAQREDAAAPADSKMLVVLNQQLGDARESNERLAQKVRELEARLADSVAAAPGGDDLTRIKGIGPKVASQLQALGIHCYGQLAELEAAALEDVTHPLHTYKGRIIKDAWIEQAREFELRE